MEPRDINNLSEIMDLIFNSQWNIPPDNLPLKEQEVIIKINDNDEITISHALFINDKPNFHGISSVYDDNDYDVGFCWRPSQGEEEIFFEIDSTYIAGWMNADNVEGI